VSGIALYATVFLAALGESTALVGLLVPGVGVVLAASVVAARGGGSLTGVAAAASAGAVVGFGLSYYIGLAGGRRLSLWSQRAHGALEKAKAFLDRFGGWGVFWGHFFGPVRACVPLVAGAGKLSPRRFWIASVSGGVAWGFALTAMGAALSRGWRLAEAVLGRGSLLLAGFAAILYVVLRLSAGALALGLRLLPSTSSAILNFLLQHGDARQLRRLAPAHPRLLAWVQRRLAPDHATGLLLSTGAVACACFAWLFFGIVEDLLSTTLS
jgi:undecaprenyl-diphosphatase